MKGFEPVTLSWKGQEFVVPAESQLGLIARLEDALEGASGVPAIVVLTREGGPSYTRLASAYGAALRYAGANVGDDEIYLSIVEGIANADANVATVVQQAIIALLAIIAPPVYDKVMGDAPKKQEAPAKAG